MSRVARKILFDKDIRALELNFYVVVTLKKSLINTDGATRIILRE